MKLGRGKTELIGVEKRVEDLKAKAKDTETPVTNNVEATRSILNNMQLIQPAKISIS